MIYVLIILFISVVYLLIKVKKLEKKIVEEQPLDILETLNGGVILMYKNKEIFNVKPKE
ncbi:hypothetical protein CJ739_94 [Mariniflexile rhizosphaerae]|uniref:hypothetical protein n=1 Tax=unclassified Mariniflexile TaxID=2643887 RepID=UPI000E336B31|nr:hypothetical protein [Mariniflexile sp. TRM1-10]AXP79194.1 hypothetical protein CJ739_94 [Mariniflexile sp. TRM1-10]